MNTGTYESLIDPKEIEETFRILEALEQKRDNAFSKKTELFSKKGELAKRIKNYQNDVSDLEDDAMFSIFDKEGQLPDGSMVPLVNKEQREAFARKYSKDSRRKLIELEGEMLQLKEQIEESDSVYSHISKKIDSVKYRLQAVGNTLNFAASNGKITHAIEIEAKTDLNVNQLRSVVADLSNNITGVTNMSKEVNFGIRTYCKDLKELLEGVTAAVVNLKRPVKSPRKKIMRKNTIE